MPWARVWTSMAFWAILVANFANNWGFHLLLTELPQYLSEIFPDYMDTGSKKGLWTAIPYGTMWIGEGQQRPIRKRRREKPFLATGTLEPEVLCMHGPVF